MVQYKASLFLLRGLCSFAVSVSLVSDEVS